MKGLRVMMAMLVAALVPLWCCCAAMAASAAQIDAEPAAKSCCDSKPADPKPQPQPEPENPAHDRCGCEADQPKLPPAAQAPAVPGLELIQSLLVFAPLLGWSLDAGAPSTCGGAPVAAGDAPPACTLLSQHTLLLN